MASPKTVADGCVVGIYYTLSNDSGEVIHSNRNGGKPLAYLQGAGNILPALERALLGKEKDETVSVELAPDDAYGERDPAALQKVPRSAFPPDVDVQPGLRLSGRDDEGREVSAAIHAVEGDEVVLDHNHPLAGERLRFDVLIAGVRPASEEERAHGHPHAPGEHHH